MSTPFEQQLSQDLLAARARIIQMEEAVRHFTSQTVEARRELSEARLEIARHHADFDRIKDVLQFTEQNYPLTVGDDTKILAHIIKSIRNIVG